MEAILWGFHHNQWQHASSELWYPPQARRDGSKPKCKYPPELTVSLVTQAWNLFKVMWAKCNEILHGPDTRLYAIRAIDRDCTDCFLEFKRKQFEWFQSIDRFMFDVPLRDFLSWSRDRCRTLLHTWERLKKVYFGESS